jgi:hypothetical protein
MFLAICGNAKPIGTGSDVFVIGWLRRRDWRQDRHASAPLRDLLKGSGVTSENVLASAKEQIARSEGRLR